MTVQAQILELIKELHDELNSAVLSITHDLGVAAETCDKVLVMYGGQRVEEGPVDAPFYAPEMAYTWGLLRSMPRMDSDRQTRRTPIPGQPPSLINVPIGCVSNTRCPFTDRVDHDRSRTEHPNLLQSTSGHDVRCHIPTAVRQEIWHSEIVPTL